MDSSVIAMFDVGEPCDSSGAKAITDGIRPSMDSKHHIVCYADVSKANAMTACAVRYTHVVRRRISAKCYDRMR